MGKSTYHNGGVCFRTGFERIICDCSDCVRDGWGRSNDIRNLDRDHLLEGKMSKETQQLIRNKCNELAEMLVKKNESYGDSAFQPVNVFASGTKLSPSELLLVRMDDKLARIRNGNATTLGEDSFWDLAGYLILYLIQQDKSKGPTYRLPGEIYQFEHPTTKKEDTPGEPSSELRQGWEG